MQSKGRRGSLFRYRFLNLLEEIDELVEKRICASEDDHLLSDDIWIPLGCPVNQSYVSQMKWITH
jgi:hypothetical protein